MARVGILVGTKGRGSNMRALIDACRSGVIPNATPVVFAPDLNAPAARLAQELHVEVHEAPREPESLTKVIEGAGLDVLCLAGFMRLVPISVLEILPRRVLNVHPALLPKFGGKGMYGMHVHEAVLEAGEAESGASVHFVTEQYDEGAVIAQERCPVLPDDTPEELAARVLACEHALFPRTVAAILAENQ
ncbi:MAG: phosphoribosylglycinamide formyltransferase [Fimbriimonadaceae bacterium]|nr:phosphoribosylglycinamide formyltransferase [Fimbriimonadaceae bacterium]